MQGRPALAFTTELLEDLLDTLYHAPTDTPDQVDTNLIVELTEAIEELIVTWP